MTTPPAARLAAVRAAAEQSVPRVIDLTARIAAVPAPTDDEALRSRLVADLFREAGVPFKADELGDIVATLAAGDAAPPTRSSLLLAAHLDTVFPAGTPLSIERDGDRLHGPGVGDNSLGVAALLALPALLAAARQSPAAPVLLVANVGEEGLGNLRGMRAVLDARSDVGAVVAVEGHNLGRVTHVAVGSRRIRIVVRGPGGHSWGDHGRPSAVHALARLIADLDALPLTGKPKTTLNVGLIDGGVSVNTIAPIASCLVDLRSVDPAALARLGQRVDRAIERANRDGVSVATEELGQRPAGVVPLDAPIVRQATATLAALGVETVYDASSTDANAAIGRGIPALCIGLTSGGNAHRADEFIDIPPVATGLAQLALLTLGLADELASGTPVGGETLGAGGG